jgi:hypothetical protein
MHPKHYPPLLEDQEALFRVARWIDDNRRRVEKIRQLAGTEERYLLIMKEVDRVQLQVSRARSLQAAATLTLVEWFATLVYFRWQCAYCLERPFQVMSHVTPLPRGGTTVDNCVPACFSCGRYNKKENARVSAYLSGV